MNLTTPTISVVITCYTEGEFIKHAVNSVLQQSVKPLEIIIVNDASPHEETNKVCRELAQLPQIRLVERPDNGGTSIARNHGFEIAIGEILVPLDADDCLPENALALIQSTFAQSPSISFIYGKYLREDQPEHLQVIDPGDITLSRMLRAKPWSLSSQWALIGTTPLRKSLWQSVGGYDPEFDNNDLHDVEFWIRVLSSGCNYQFVSQPIYHWRKYLGSNSRKVTPLAWYRIAHKHFDIYCDADLEYRANELLLLGSKWMNQEDQIKRYSRSLIQAMQRDSYQFSSFIILLLPARLLQVLAELRRRER
jgi:glycosyltransferase involved in cell wall biosynthesis